MITSIYFHKPSRRLFDQCIRWLKKYGYVFISVDELTDILDGTKPLPRGAVWLSLDDGWREVLDNVLPVIRAHHVPVTLFIPSGIVEGEGLFHWLGAPPDRDLAPGLRDAITIDELKELSAHPEVTIGGHTVTHPLTTQCTDAEICFELGESKRALECWTGKAVTSFAYPCGEVGGNERRFLREFGYRLAATTNNGFITEDADHFLVPRFSVADDIPFLEAICNMVGVWTPAVDRLKLFKPTPVISSAKGMMRRAAGLSS